MFKKVTHPHASDGLTVPTTGSERRCAPLRSRGVILLFCGKLFKWGQIALCPISGFGDIARGSASPNIDHRRPIAVGLRSILALWLSLIHFVSHAPLGVRWGAVRRSARFSSRTGGSLQWIVSRVQLMARMGRSATVGRGGKPPSAEMPCSAWVDEQFGCLA